MAETKLITNALLKTLLTDTICLRGGGDIDTYLTPGHVHVNDENWKNFPQGAYRYGVLVCFGSSKSFMAQIFLPHQKGKLYWRVYYCPQGNTSGTWGDWRVVESQVAT